MALIGNHSLLNKSFGRNYGGSTLAIALHMNNKSSSMSTNILRQRMGFQFAKAAITSGYGPGSAIMMPKSTGELGARRIEGIATVTATALSAMIASLNAIAGTSTVLGAANAIGLVTVAGTSAGIASVTANTLVASSMSGISAGVASVVANLGAVIPCSASAAGVASSSVNLKGTGRLNGVISIGASGYLSNDDVERLAEAVWDAVSADHLTAGTTGKALSDAGGAGNPWSSPLVGNDTAGTFGERVQKLLTTSKFMGTK